MSDKKKPKICWITPGHLCNSPRLVKEVSSLYKLDYETSVIATQYLPFLSLEDERFRHQYPNCKIKLLDWTNQSRKSLIRRYYSGIIQKALRWINRYIPFLILDKIILNRHYHWQLEKALAQQADLYIAHNAGALAIAADAAIALKAKFAFDAEDFHMGEIHATAIQRAIENLEKHYLPQSAYISAASPLIAKAYQDSYRLSNPITTILNVFPKQEQDIIIKENHHPLKLFWFSQYVGRNRGLEEGISALGQLQHKAIELHILGKLEQQEADCFYNLMQQQGVAKECIFFHSPIPEANLLSFAYQFDIGLALEKDIPFSRAVCLTNKLFTYIQAGIGVIASKTPAQEGFLKNHPKHTLLIDLDHPTALAEAIMKLATNPTLLSEMKKRNKAWGENNLNWNTEEDKFISIIDTCLAKERSL
jgi:glycosyltransferase involved in cell wall biosynthesis